MHHLQDAMIADELRGRAEQAERALQRLTDLRDAMESDSAERPGIDLAVAALSDELATIQRARQEHGDQRQTRDRSNPRFCGCALILLCFIAVTLGIVKHIPTAAVIGTTAGGLVILVMAIAETISIKDRLKNRRRA